MKIAFGNNTGAFAFLDWDNFVIMLLIFYPDDLISLLLKDLLGSLLSHAAHQGQIGDHCIQEIGVKGRDLHNNHWLVGENRLLRFFRVRGEHPPVNKGAVPHIRCLHSLGGCLQKGRDGGFSRGGEFQKDLHSGSQNGELHFSGFFHKPLDKLINHFDATLYLFAVLSEYPDGRCLSLGILGNIEVLGQRFEGIVAVDFGGVLAVNVHHCDHNLLDCVDWRRLRTGSVLDEVHQDLNALVHELLEVQTDNPDCFDGLDCEINVHIASAFLEFVEHHLAILQRTQLYEYLDLLILYVVRLIEFAKKHFDHVIENGGPLLNQIVDVPQNHVLDLRELVVDQRNQRLRNLLSRSPNQLGTSHIIQVLHQHLHCRKHHRTVNVLQPRIDPLNNLLRLLQVLRNVISQAVQNKHLPPLNALVDAIQQPLQHHRLNVQHGLFAHLGNLVQGDHYIRNHHRIAFSLQHLLHFSYQSGLLNLPGIQLVNLWHAQHRRLPHIRVPVLYSLLHRPLQILIQRFHSQAPHRAQRQRFDQRRSLRYILA